MKRSVMMKLVLAVAVIATAPLSAAKINESDVTFEFYNKDKESVRIAEFKVYGGSIKNIDFGAATFITPPRDGLISASRAHIKVDDANKFLIFMEIKHPRGSYKYTIRPGHKTVFVSFTTDKSPALYPQTGPLKGWLGKTESGLPLKNNLKAADIVQGDTRSTVEKIAGAFGSGY